MVHTNSALDNISRYGVNFVRMEVVNGNIIHTATITTDEYICLVAGYLYRRYRGDRLLTRIRFKQSYSIDCRFLYAAIESNGTKTYFEPIV